MHDDDALSPLCCSPHYSVRRAPSSCSFLGVVVKTNIIINSSSLNEESLDLTHTILLLRRLSLVLLTRLPGAPH